MVNLLRSIKPLSYINVTTIIVCSCSPHEDIQGDINVHYNYNTHLRLFPIYGLKTFKILHNSKERYIINTY